MVLVPPGSEVLIIDDEEELQEILEFMVSSAGYIPLLGGSVKAAKEALVKSPHIAAAFVDFNLPDGQGIDIAKHFSEQGKSIPFFLLSGVDPERVPQRELFAMILGKPFTPQDITRALKGAG